MNPRLLILLAAFVAVPLAAPSQTVIKLGQKVTGRLTVSDQKFSDGSRYKMYTFVGIKGDSVAVDLVSDDFDANLIIADASGNTLKRNDDGGDNCNARLTFVPPLSASYRIYANTSAPAELGDFSLALAKGKAQAPADSTCHAFGRVIGMIDVGQTIKGSLSSEDQMITSDSTFYERYVLPVHASQAFTIDLQSDDFDGYLMLTTSRGEKIIDNDDGGGGCNARIVYTATDEHPLRVIVNSASNPKRQVGQFTLRVSRGAKPTEPKSNCRIANVRQASVRHDDPPETHPISIGATQKGQLTRSDVLLSNDSTYAQAWIVQGTAGETVTIDLQSDAFDPFLFLRGPGIQGGRDFQDDDSGGNCASRLTVTFPQTGEYQIVVNSQDRYATGPFTLTVTKGYKAKSIVRCSRTNQ